MNNEQTTDNLDNPAILLAQDSLNHVAGVMRSIPDGDTSACFGDVSATRQLAVIKKQLSNAAFILGRLREPDYLDYLSRTKPNEIIEVAKSAQSIESTLSMILHAASKSDLGVDWRRVDMWFTENGTLSDEHQWDIDANRPANKERYVHWIETATSQAIEALKLPEIGATIAAINAKAEILQQEQLAAQELQAAKELEMAQERKQTMQILAKLNSEGRPYFNEHASYDERFIFNYSEQALLAANITLELTKAPSKIEELDANAMNSILNCKQYCNLRLGEIDKSPQFAANIKFDELNKDLGNPTPPWDKDNLAKALRNTLAHTIASLETPEVNATIETIRTKAKELAHGKH